MRAAILGGPRQLVPRFVQHLEEAGVVVTNADSYREGVLHIPLEAEVVIFLTTRCTHSESASAEKAARNRGLPFLPVTCQWAQAEPLLRKHRFLPHEEEKVEMPEDTWDEGRVKAVIGPPLAEIKAVLDKHGQWYNDLECMLLEVQERQHTLSEAMSLQQGALEKLQVAQQEEPRGVPEALPLQTKPMAAAILAELERSFPHPVTKVAWDMVAPLLGTSKENLVAALTRLHTDEGLTPETLAVVQSCGWRVAFVCGDSLFLPDGSCKPLAKNVPEQVVTKKEDLPAQEPSLRQQVLEQLQRYPKGLTIDYLHTLLPKVARSSLQATVSKMARAQKSGVRRLGRGLYQLQLVEEK